MSHKQNEEKLDRSSQTEFNPGKFTFDLSAVSTTDVNAALSASDKDIEDAAVSDLQRMEVVDSPLG
ncbi:hypothetical protein KBI23_03815 [bacterium]|nr:hypothetical protein [bacterium]MBP9810004.1 hypothetical protein [bacterium]